MRKYKIKDSRKGERSPNAKLTWSDVEKIRKDHIGGKKIMDIAKEYHMSYQAISNIIKNKTWMI